MSIEYTYEIISVNAEARCMEIVYNAEGHQTMHVGARLPYEGESLESVVDMYSPVRYWQEQKLTVTIPQVGATGTVSSTVSDTVTQEIVAPYNAPADVVNVTLTEL